MGPRLLLPLLMGLLPLIAATPPSAYRSSPALHGHPFPQRPAGLPLYVRGGAAVEAAGETVRVTVLTIAGSPHLDLKTRLDVPLTANVSALKAMVHERMSGHPPQAVQRLVFGTRVLADEETVESLVAPPERDEFDEDEDEDDEGLGGGVAGAAGGGGSGGAGPKQLSVILDILPPLPVDKSLPAALEAKLKAYAAEVVAVRHLTDELVSGVLAGGGAARSEDEEDGGGEDEEGGEDGGREDGEPEAGNGGDGVMRTEGLKAQIKSMEEHVLKLVARNITERKTKIHSAVAEDGRVDVVWHGGGGSEGDRLGHGGDDGAGAGSDVGPWRQFQRTAKHHADVNWKETLRNMVTCFFVAKFGAHGPAEETIIMAAAVGLVVWQMRFVRLGLKVCFALASEFRGGPLVDLLSTLLPTSHQALLEAEDEAGVSAAALEAAEFRAKYFGR